MTTPPRSPLLTTTLAVPAGEALRVTVVADTHSSPNPAALVHLRRLGPHAILHAGDIGDPAVLDALAEIAPVVAVRGNIDGRGLPDARIVELIGCPAGDLRVLLTHIAVRGPKLRADVARLAADCGAGLVVCGHSHVPFIGRDCGFAVFNPGSIGPRRFALPVVFGLISLDSKGLHLSHVDAETGSPWSPPTAGQGPGAPEPAPPRYSAPRKAVDRSPRRGG